MHKHSIVAVWAAVATFASSSAFVGTLHAGVFDAGVATYEQHITGTWSASLAIDGITNGVFDGAHPTGWSILKDPYITDPTPVPQSAFFRLASSVQLTSDTPTLRIDLYQLFEPASGVVGTSQYHTLGAFRLLYTTADLHSSPFTVTSASAVTWTPLNPSLVMTPIPSGTVPSYTMDASGAIFVDGPGLAKAIYSLTATPGQQTITGIRLDVLTDSALPYNGPGFCPINGNFVLNEITLQAAPEPASLATVAAGSLFLLSRRRRIR